MSLLPFPFPESSASLLEWRQNLIAQLYVATTALSSYELNSAELERLREQGSGLQWCALQQQVLAPGSMDETATKPSLPPSPSCSPSPSPTLVEACPMRDTQMMIDSPPRHQGKISPYSPPSSSPYSSPSLTGPATPTTTMRGELSSSSPSSSSPDAFFLKFRPLIEQLLAKARVSVANYRWKPKRDPGDVAKLNNLTRGKVDQLVGLDEFIVEIWNADSPPFPIKPALSFSPRGHIYCVACKFTYVHLHKDYVKFIEHFTCVSHLARCRDMDTEENPEEMGGGHNRENEAMYGNGNNSGNVLVKSESPQQSLLHQFAQFVTQTDHSMLS